MLRIVGKKRGRCRVDDDVVVENAAEKTKNELAFGDVLDVVHSRWTTMGERVWSSWEAGRDDDDDDDDDGHPKSGVPWG